MSCNRYVGFFKLTKKLISNNVTYVDCFTRLNNFLYITIRFITLLVSNMYVEETLFIFFFYLIISGHSNQESTNSAELIRERIVNIIGRSLCKLSSMEVELMSIS